MKKLNKEKKENPLTKKKRKKSKMPFRRKVTLYTMIFLLLLAPFFLMQRCDKKDEVKEFSGATKMILKEDEPEALKQAKASGLERIDFGYRYFAYGEDVFLANNYINQADAKSFEAFNGAYAKDHKNVYIYGEDIPDADPATFFVLKDGYAKDKNKVYFFGKIIKNADPATFKVTAKSYYNFTEDKNRSWQYAQL